jgi:hypothetical protein
MPDPQPTDLTPFQSIAVTPERAMEAAEDRRDLEEGLQVSGARLASILPVPEIDLTAEEHAFVTRQRLQAIVMDVAGVAAMRCAEACPFQGACTLAACHKTPLGQFCPFEVDFLRERFLGWLRELERTLDTVLESERLAIGNLCALQLELQRIRKVLARAENVEMDQVSVRDVNVQTGEPICWEHIIHTAAQREDQILAQIRMIMKDFELTPEAKTRKAKALGLRQGNDIANKQAGLNDLIRSRNRRPIDVPSQPVAAIPAPVSAPAGDPGPIR